ncbi:MAG: LptF/LptG family permease [Deltaproteobacteria bacterium]|nr:LptF/LptG family permease [Deltaproteobacteria bacterium]
MGTVLSRYVARLYLRLFAGCVVTAVALVLVVNFFGRIGEFASYRKGFVPIAWYFVLLTPKMAADIYPAAALLAVSLSVAMLIRDNELLAMRACGVSNTRIAMPLLAISAVLGVLVFVWSDTIVPLATARARVVKNQDIRDLRGRGLLDSRSIWLETPQGFLNVAIYDARTRTIHDLSLYEVARPFRISRIVDVTTAHWEADQWRADDGSVRTFGADGAFETRPLAPGTLQIPQTPADFRNERPQGVEFGYRKLADKIAVLEARGLDPNEYKVDLALKLALPFSGLVTVLLGFPLAMRSTGRGGSLYSGAGRGMAAAFLYWMALALAVAAGHSGTLPPLIAAWSTNVVFALIGALLFVDATG